MIIHDSQLLVLRDKMHVSGPAPGGDGSSVLEVFMLGRLKRSLLFKLQLELGISWI